MQPNEPHAPLATVTAVIGPADPDHPERGWSDHVFVAAFDLAEDPGFDVIVASDGTRHAALQGGGFDVTTVPAEEMHDVVARLVAAGTPVVVVAGMDTIGGAPWLLDRLADDPATAPAGRALRCVDPDYHSVTYLRVAQAAVDAAITGTHDEGRMALHRAALLRHDRPG